MVVAIILDNDVVKSEMTATPKIVIFLLVLTLGGAAHAICPDPVSAPGNQALYINSSRGCTSGSATVTPRGALALPTALAVTGATTLTDTVSGIGIISLFASPPAIGGTTPGAGNFTTQGATGAVDFPVGATLSGRFAGSPTIFGSAIFFALTVNDNANISGITYSPKFESANTSYLIRSPDGNETSSIFGDPTYNID